MISSKVLGSRSNPPRARGAQDLTLCRAPNSRMDSAIHTCTTCFDVGAALHDGYLRGRHQAVSGEGAGRALRVRVKLPVPWFNTVTSLKQSGPSFMMQRRTTGRLSIALQKRVHALLIPKTQTSMKMATLLHLVTLDNPNPYHTNIHVLFADLGGCSRFF